jgi:hypothetical protein
LSSATPYFQLVITDLNGLARLLLLFHKRSYSLRKKQQYLDFVNLFNLVLHSSFFDSPVSFAPFHNFLNPHFRFFSLLLFYSTFSFSFSHFFTVYFPHLSQVFFSTRSSPRSPLNSLLPSPLLSSLYSPLLFDPSSSS